MKKRIKLAVSKYNKLMSSDEIADIDFHFFTEFKVVKEASRRNIANTTNARDLDLKSSLMITNYGNVSFEESGARILYKHPEYPDDKFYLFEEQ